MARMHKTPRFPLGSRVLKYFAGYKDPFGGTVDDYSQVSGFYHISYDDGDSEEMTEADLQVHIVSLPSAPPPAPAPVEPPKPKKTMILNLNDNAPDRSSSGKPSPVSSTSSSSSSSSSAVKAPSPHHAQQSAITSPRNRPAASSDRPPPGEENALIGRGIAKRFVDKDGTERIVKGTVSSYFLATRKFRVVFFDGRCEDLSYSDVVDSLPLSPPSNEESKKRKLADNDSAAAAAAAAATVSSASPKKFKAMDSNGSSSSSSSSESSREPVPTSKGGERDEGILAELSPPFDTSKGLTDVFAHNISRNVLFIVVSSSSDANESKKRQLAVLTNRALKPKKALKMFVANDGLVTLGDLLNKWTETTDTETGVLVVLKILAVLPGVTADYVGPSKVGRTLHKIWKNGESWGFNASIPDLARWIIKKWKKQFFAPDNESASRKTEVSASSSSSSSSHSSNGKKPKQKDKRSDESEAKSKSESANGGANGNSNGVTSKRSNSANHLRDLMGSRGAPSRDVLGSALGSKPKRLGPAYAHRARRSTVVLEAVGRRVNENNAEANNSEKATNADGDEPDRPTRIAFNEPMYIEFSKEVEVSKLLVWGPIGGRRSTPVIRPGPLTTRRLKSILRVRLEPTPAPVVAEPENALMAPPVVQTASAAPTPSSSSSGTRHLDLSGSPPTSAPESERFKQARAVESGKERALSWSAASSCHSLSPLPDDDDVADPGLFARRREQTNRSPPPDFDLTHDEDGRSSTRSSPHDSVRDEIDSSNGDDDGVEEGEEHEPSDPQRLVLNDHHDQQQSPVLRAPSSPPPPEAPAVARHVHALDLDESMPFAPELPHESSRVESVSITAE